MMSPLLIAGLVVVCLAALYYFDLFGAKKSTNKKLRELCMRIPDKFADQCEKGYTHTKSGCLKEGTSVLCNKSDPLQNGGVYRVMANGIAWYPSESVANSWDPNWRSEVNIDCTGLNLLPTMRHKYATPYYEGNQQYNQPDIMIGPGSHIQQNIKCAPDEIAGATFEYDKVNKRMNRVLKCYKKGQLPKHMLHLRKDETNDHIMPTKSPLPVRGDESLVPHGVGSYEVHVRAKYPDPWDRM